MTSSRRSALDGVGGMRWWRRDGVVAAGGGEVDLRGRWRCGSEMREGDMSFFSFPKFPKVAVQNYRREDLPPSFGIGAQF